MLHPVRLLAYARDPLTVAPICSLKTVANDIAMPQGVLLVAILATPPSTTPPVIAFAEGHFSELKYGAAAADAALEHWSD